MLDAQIVVEQDNLQVSKESLSLLKSMLNKDPQRRPTAEQCLNVSYFLTTKILIFSLTNIITSDI